MDLTIENVHEYLHGRAVAGLWLGDLFLRRVANRNLWGLTPLRQVLLFYELVELTGILLNLVIESFVHSKLLKVLFDTKAKHSVTCRNHGVLWL